MLGQSCLPCSITRAFARCNLPALGLDPFASLYRRCSLPPFAFVTAHAWASSVMLPPRSYPRDGRCDGLIPPRLEIGFQANSANTNLRSTMPNPDFQDPPRLPCQRHRRQRRRRVFALRVASTFAGPTERALSPMLPSLGARSDSERIRRPNCLLNSSHLMVVISGDS